jgi:hypothetical protein
LFWIKKRNLNFDMKKLRRGRGILQERASLRITYREPQNIKEK